MDYSLMQGPMGEPLTDEELQMLLTMGGDAASLEQQIAMQMKQAEILRGQIQPPQTQMLGNVAVPPHFMQLLGGLAQSKVSGDLMRDATGKQAERQGITNRQNSMVMKGLGMNTPVPRTNQSNQTSDIAGGGGFKPLGKKRIFSFGD